MSNILQSVTARRFFAPELQTAHSVSSNISAQSFGSFGSLPKTPRTAKSHFTPMSMPAFKLIKAIFTKPEVEITAAIPDASYSGASPSSIHTNFSCGSLITGSTTSSQASSKSKQNAPLKAGHAVASSVLTASVLEQLNQQADADDAAIGCSHPKSQKQKNIFNTLLRCLSKKHSDTASTDSAGDAHHFNLDGVVIPGIKAASEILENDATSTFNYQVWPSFKMVQKDAAHEVYGGMDTHPSFSSQGSDEETKIPRWSFVHHKGPQKTLPHAPSQTWQTWKGITSFDENIFPSLDSASTQPSQQQAKKRSLLGFLRNMCAGQAPQVCEFAAAPVAGNSLGGVMEIDIVENLNKPLDDGTYLIETAENAGKWLTDLNASTDVLHGFSPFGNHKKSASESSSK